MTVLTHTHPLVAQLEAALLPQFQAALPDLMAAAPSVLASVFAFSTGTGSAFQDYHFGISCLLDAAPEDAPEEVALLVSVTGLEAQAQLSAQVAWGQPSGHIEARAALADASVTALQESLPALLTALQGAVRATRPWEMAVQT